MLKLSKRSDYICNMPNNSSTGDSNVSFFTSLWRAQATSILSSTTDYLVFLFLQFCDTFYVISTVGGALCGAVVSFNLSRNWAYKSTEKKVHTQAIKYACASGFSLVMNVLGMVLFVEQFKMNEEISKLIVAVVVGLFINFPIYKYWVFKK